MRSVLCMSLSEQATMLKELGFQNAHLRYNLQNNSSHPYCIDGVTDEDASILLELYGKTADKFDGPTYSLGVTSEMVARMAAKHLQVNVEEVLPLEGGELLIFPHRDVSEIRKVTIYGGYVRNLVTNEYERLFSTELSALLACNRAREAANYQNSAIQQLKAEYARKGGGELWLNFLEEQTQNGNPNVAFYRLGKKYDSDDIVVQSCYKIIATVSSDWGRLSDKDITLAENAARISKKNGPMPKYDMEEGTQK